jgi:hypothetical protein
MRFAFECLARAGKLRSSRFAELFGQMLLQMAVERESWRAAIVRIRGAGWIGAVALRWNVLVE